MSAGQIRPPPERGRGGNDDDDDGEVVAHGAWGPSTDAARMARKSAGRDRVFVQVAIRGDRVDLHERLLGAGDSIHRRWAVARYEFPSAIGVPRGIVPSGRAARAAPEQGGRMNAKSWHRCVLGGLIGVASLVGEPAAAVTYVEPHVFESPTGTHDTYFGQSVTVTGNYLAAGSYVPEPRVYIFDRTTGALAHTIVAPASGEAFGEWLSVTANGRLIVGSLFTHAYLFDAASGGLLQTFTIPGGGNLGYGVAALGNDVLVPAPPQNRVYLFDAVSGAVIRTYDGPVAGEGFARSVATSGNVVLVTAPFDATHTGRAYVFDATTGQLLHTVSNPTPDPDDFFGDGAAAGPLGLLVAAPGDDTAGADAGAAYLFDATTGQLVRTFLPPAPATMFGFGYALAWYGGNVLISARNANGGDGVVYLFDASSGTLLATMA